MLLVLAVSLAATAKPPSFLTSAVSDPARPAEDRGRDAERKPAQTLDFAGLRPGMKVAELIPGGGYFTRVLSLAVGPSGHLYAMAPAKPADAPADAPDRSAAARAVAADAHFANVSVLAQPMRALDLPRNLDLVFTAQNYHDLHNAQGLDLRAFNKAVFDALKPGGVYLVIDHEAQTGSGARDTSTLHRIESQTVIDEASAAGFKLDGQSELLHEPADTHTLKVFDPQVRGKTDQFLLKFRKPKAGH